MTDTLESTNRAIQQGSPAFWAALSPLGQRLYYPPDIPFQAAEAKKKTYNGSIGQITDGHGKAVALPSVEAGLLSMPAERRNQALLYSPVQGIKAVREAWQRWHRRWAPEGVATTLPLVTSGITHGLSMVAELFVPPGRTVVLPHPYWDNYTKIFSWRLGARVLDAPAYRGDGYNVTGVGDAIGDLPAGEPVVTLLNFPSNPGGYAPTTEERAGIIQNLVEVAEKRPLVVICDDAYAGLVFEENVPARSIFWDLIGLNENLIPIKLDGITKELSFFGGRLGFVTLPYAADTAFARAAESKLVCLGRATVGSPVAVTQMLTLGALLAEGFAEEVAALRRMLAGRYRGLRLALAEADPELIHPMPFNSGCFAVIRLPEGLDAETLRRHLLDQYDLGLVAIDPQHMRVAHCSVAEEALPEMVRRLERGVADLVGQLARP